MLAAQGSSGHRYARIARPSQTNTVVAVENDFDFRSAHYLRLFQNSNATAFQHPLWLDAFYRLVVPANGAQKIVITAREEETGMLRLVMPFVRREANGMTLLETADLGVSDIAVPVSARGFEVSDAIREKIAEMLPDHDLMRIRPVRNDTLEAWQTVIEGDVHSMDFFGSSQALSGPFPEWRSGALGQAFRKQAEADAGRALKCGASHLKLLDDSADIANAITAIRASRHGRFEADRLQDKATFDFYTSLAVAGSGAGFSRTYAVMQDNAAIGHVFAISWKNQTHYILIGCDFERHGQHTTGLILHDTMVEDWSREDGSAFNFTIGDEAFRGNRSEAADEHFIVTRAPTWRGRLARASLDAQDHVDRMRRGTYLS